MSNIKKLSTVFAGVLVCSAVMPLNGETWYLTSSQTDSKAWSGDTAGQYWTNSKGEKGGGALKTDDTYYVINGKTLGASSVFGGDSLMGRYFPYRMHPFSLGEIIHTDVAETEIRAPIDSLPEEMWNHLVKFGGFPEPYARGDIMFLRRWQRLRFEQLVREDIRKDTAIREIDQIESLARILSERSGEQISYASIRVVLRKESVPPMGW